MMDRILLHLSESNPKDEVLAVTLRLDIALAVFGLAPFPRLIKLSLLSKSIKNRQTTIFILDVLQRQNEWCR